MFQIEESASQHVWLGLEVYLMCVCCNLKRKTSNKQKSNGAQKVGVKCFWRSFRKKLDKNSVFAWLNKIWTEQALSCFSLLDWKKLNPNYLQRRRVCFVLGQIQSSTIEWVPGSVWIKFFQHGFWVFNK